MLKKVLKRENRSGNPGGVELQTYLDQARALGRQVISGEVAAGRVVAPDKVLGLDGRKR